MRKVSAPRGRLLVFWAAVVLALVSAAAFSQQTEVEVKLTPNASIPLASDADFFGIGGGVRKLQHHGLPPRLEGDVADQSLSAGARRINAGD